MKYKVLAFIATVTLILSSCGQNSDGHAGDQKGESVVSTPTTPKTPAATPPAATPADEKSVAKTEAETTESK